MGFEEIQSIWDSQSSTGGGGDDDALMRQIQARDRSFRRFVGITEIAMTLTLLFVAFMFVRDPLIEGHDRVLILPGIVSVLAAGFVWTGRIARKKREPRFDRTLLGIVEQSIDAIDYQIQRMRSFLWWFVGPTSLGLVIGLFIVDDSKRYLFTTIFIPAFIACMALAYWQIRREIRLQLLPEKVRLEELRGRIG